MGKPWTPEHRKNFIATMRKRFPHGTRSKARRAAHVRNLLARDPHKFDMVQFKAKSNGHALQEVLSTLRTERVRVNERLQALDAAIGSLMPLTKEHA